MDPVWESIDLASSVSPAQDISNEAELRHGKELDTLLCKITAWNYGQFVQLLAFHTKCWRISKYISIFSSLKFKAT